MADIKRRDVLRYGAAGAVTVTTAVAAAQGLSAAEPAAGLAKAPGDPRDFDESYKGKNIRGRHIARGRDELHVNNRKLALTLITTLFVPEDGSQEHVGVGYISAVNHYDPVEIDEDKQSDGLKKLARKVVDILGDLELSDEAGKEHQH